MAEHPALRSGAAPAPPSKLEDPGSIPGDRAYRDSFEGVNRELYAGPIEQNLENQLKRAIARYREEYGW